MPTKKPGPDYVWIKRYRFKKLDKHRRIRWIKGYWRKKPKKKKLKRRKRRKVVPPPPPPERNTRIEITVYARAGTRGGHQPVSFSVRITAVRIFKGPVTQEDIDQLEKQAVAELASKVRESFSPTMAGKLEFGVPEVTETKTDEEPTFRLEDYVVENLKHGKQVRLEEIPGREEKDVLETRK